MINSVVLVGRLTKDVEVRKTNGGISVARFTVACDRRYSKDPNNKQTDFISCIAWRQQADFLGQYARKGAMVGVEGRIQTGSYDRQDGTKAYTTDVVCDSVQLLESKARSEQRAQQQSDPYANSYNNSYDSFTQPSYSAPQQSAPAVDDGFGSGLDISNDDLPF